MKNKKLLVAVLVLIVVIGALFGLYVATRPDTAAGAKTITVTVVHGDGSSKEFTYKTDEEYLGSVLMAEGLVVGEMGPYGLMISAVDGEEVDILNTRVGDLQNGFDHRNQSLAVGQLGIDIVFGNDLAVVQAHRCWRRRRINR